MTPVSRLIATLEAHGCQPRPAGKGWNAYCPVHEADGQRHRKSLSVGEGEDGKALVYCHAGCSTEQICAALGLRVSDLMPNGKAERVFPSLEQAVEAYQLGRPPTVWRYHTADGTEAGAVIRWDRPGGKEIRPLRRDKDGWRLGAMPEPRPLYRLPQLLATSADTPVIVVEGEKCCDVVAKRLGLPVTTSSGGAHAAAKTDWKPLAGRHVIIVPDNDEAGQRYATEVVKLCRGAASVRILQLAEHAPGLPEGGDLADIIAAPDWCGLPLGDAATPDDFRAWLLATAVPVPAATPHVIARRLAAVTREQLAWLWPGRVPLGKLTLLAGDPGLGKSFVSLDMAARVSRGQPWPDMPLLPQPAGDVVLLNAEDDLADTIAPRLDKAGADDARIVAIEGIAERTGRRHFSLQTDLALLEEVLQANPETRLIIIDPIDAYCDRVDSYKSAEVRGLLAPLAELAGRYRVAIVAVNHLSKAGGAKAIYRAMGSLAFVAAARSVWMIVKDQGEPQRRLLLPAKLNVAGLPDGLAYTIEDGRVAWETTPVQMHADDAFAAEAAASESGHSERREAVAWLRERLAGGPMPASDVIELAKADGIAERTLRRAFKALAGQSHKDGRAGNWHWCLPGQDGHMGA